MAATDFAKLVRRHRQEAGLTQTRLGELIGRSASTIRAWERARSTPGEAPVVTALAAVLGIDEDVLFEAVGTERPAMEHTITLEQALSSIAPSAPEEEAPEEKEEQAEVEAPSVAGVVAEPGRSAPGHRRNVATGLAELLGLDRLRLRFPAGARPERRPPAERRPPPERPREHRPPPMRTGLVSTVTRSYMEDPAERLGYRLRAVYTLVGMVLVVLVLVWALGQGVHALGDLWNSIRGVR